MGVVCSYACVDVDGFEQDIVGAEVGGGCELLFVEGFYFFYCFSCEPSVIEEVWVDVVVWVVEVVEVVDASEFNTGVFTGFSEFCVGGEEFVFSDFC